LIRVLIWIAALLAVTNLSLQPVLGRDTDMWWLLAAGREMWTQGRLPLTDSFSFTHEGAPWYRIHWLYEWLVYGVYQAAGLDGVVLVRTVLVVGAFSLLAAVTATRRISPWAGAVAVVCAAGIGMRYSHIRPHFFTLFMASAFILILERARADRPRLVWLLPPLLAVWFNAHGGALVGLALTVLYALADVVERRPQARRWLYVVGACAAALFVSPQPLDFLRVALSYSFLPNEYSHVILEARTFQLRDSVPTVVFLAATLPAAVVEWRRGRVVDALLVGAFSTLIFRSDRHQYLFVPLLAPVAARSLDLCSRPLRPAFRTAAAALLAGTILWTAADIAHGATPPSRLIRWETLPEAPAAFLRANDIRGRLFNDYNWGGYLIWRLYPEDRVYVDARGDQVYDASELSAYFDILLGRPGALATLDRLGVDIVVESHLMSGSPLFRDQLPSSPEWTRAYDDGTARVWLRRKAVKEPLRDGGTFMDLFRQAAALEDSRPDEAVARFNRALAAYPDFAAAHVHLGVVLAKQGDLDSGVAHWRRALALQRDMPSANLDLGMASRARGDLEAAACYVARELEIDAGSPAARALQAELPPPRACAWRRLWERLAAPLRP